MQPSFLLLSKKKSSYLFIILPCSIKYLSRLFIPLVHAKLLQLCLTLCDPMDCIALCPWGSPGKNTGVDCHALLQRIFLTQG